MIHESVIIDPSAKIADNVDIGAYSIIGKNVCISEGTVIKEHSVIRENTTIGKNNLIYQFATIGEKPQDLKFQNEKTTCTIGDNNTFREYCIYIGEHLMEFLIQILEMEIYLWHIPMLHTTA